MAPLLTKPCLTDDLMGRGLAQVGVNRAGYLWCVAQTSSTSPGGE